MLFFTIFLKPRVIFHYFSPLTETPCYFRKVVSLDPGYFLAHPEVIWFPGDLNTSRLPSVREVRYPGDLYTSRWLVYIQVTCIHPGFLKYKYPISGSCVHPGLLYIRVFCTSRFLQNTRENKTCRTDIRVTRISRFLSYIQVPRKYESELISFGRSNIRVPYLLARGTRTQEMGTVEGTAWTKNDYFSKFQTFFTTLKTSILKYAWLINIEWLLVVVMGHESFFGNFGPRWVVLVYDGFESRFQASLMVLRKERVSSIIINSNWNLTHLQTMQSHLLVLVFQTSKNSLCAFWSKLLTNAWEKKTMEKGLVWHFLMLVCKMDQICYFLWPTHISYLRVSSKINISQRVIIKKEFFFSGLVLDQIWQPQIFSKLARISWWYGPTCMYGHGYDQVCS